MGFGRAKRRILLSACRRKEYVSGRRTGEVLWIAEHLAELDRVGYNQVEHGVIYFEK
jgi:hypothetical protein